MPRLSPSALSVASAWPCFTLSPIFTLTLRTTPGCESMIVGKAWAVYFPAPLGLKQGGVDFGRFRFIR